MIEGVDKIDTVENTDPVEDLKRLNSWSEEVPAEEIHSGDSKYRKNFYQSGIFAIFMIAENGKIKSKEAKEAVEDFIEAFANEEFKNRFTTREDIDRANKDINTILKHL